MRIALLAMYYRWSLAISCCCTLFPAVIRSDAEAQLALLLSETCRELGQWEQAESALIRVALFFEDEYGMSHGKTISLWLRISDVRLKLHRYQAAALDLEHALTMQQVLNGKGGVALISTLEKLCKARVLLRQWQPAIAALTRGALKSVRCYVAALQLVRTPLISAAHSISSFRNGLSHGETLRIADVMRDLERHADGLR